MLQEKLNARRLPDLLTMNDGRNVKTPDEWRMRRRELLELLSREEYGFSPAAPESVRGVIDPASGRGEASVYAGKATQRQIRLSFDTPGGEFAFPVTLITPERVAKAPAFVYLGFQSDIPSPYLPMEEIIDHGFALASFCYTDITADGPDFDKLGAMYPRDEKTGWGKLGIWAFAASRVMDYLETRDDIDPARVCVTGHSRLGKAALWCGAQDERFSMTVANDSGCSGAALSRGKGGETIEIIAKRFPFWFCGNYQAWRGRENEAPFDQHMLAALCAPRKVYVNSASLDDWADPESEFLGCLAASPAWTVQRVPGLVTPDRIPEPDAPLTEGGVCYHVRTGTHFYSRTDWLWQMACREKFHV